MLLTHFLAAQNADLEVIIQEQLNVHAASTNRTTADVSDWRITDKHISRQSGIQHVYIRQQYQGIEIVGANADIHLLSKEQNNKVVSFNSKFVANVAPNIRGGNVTTTPELSAIEAVEAAANRLDYRLSEPLQIIKNYDSTGRNLLLSKGGISLEDIPAKLVYQAQADGQLKLAWDISILEPNQNNWWHLQIDAVTGQILQQYNWIVQCTWNHPHSAKEKNNCQNHHSTNSSLITHHSSLITGGYNVYPMPIESPSHGDRAIVMNPEDTIASPYGWHDTNGEDGAEYTITRGNNVYAQEDIDGMNNTLGFSPNGGATLNFDFPIDLTKDPETNKSANITNLFYWNNIIHDVAYHYGFDEISGNFQENNYGNGGEGTDYVLADAQDGSGTNNANFGTPPDGTNPRMQMFLWNGTPKIDGDLDNGIILHEYGHGISNRLTGGRTNSSCLNNEEQMGEGWSDFWGMMLTMKDTDQGTDKRGVGTYAIDEPITGDGIRTYPYSTDLAINPHTYKDINNASIPHGVGSVWCAMLWDMSWELIGQHGFSDDFYKGTGGNNIAMALVMEGMKLQPCSPGFIDGRDAILKADTALYDGANSCLIWKAFTKRGLGYSATQGDSDKVDDGKEAFDLPPGVNEQCTSDPIFSITIAPNRKAACAGEDFVFDVTVLAFNGYEGEVTLSSTTLPTGTAASLAETTINTFPSTTTWTISNTTALATGDYPLEISGTDGTLTNQRSATLEVLPIAVAPILVSPADSAQEVSLIQTLQWTAAFGAVSYDLQIATDAEFTTLVLDTMALTNTTFFTEALSPNTTYYWRVKSNSCEVSDFSSIYQFTIIPACGQTFTDTGGSSENYSNSESIKWVFCPENEGEFVRITFTSFDVERRSSTACWDYMEVYDAKDDSDSATSFGQFCGTTLEEAPEQGVVTATNATGCLTFVFNSDEYVTPAGWEATISCLNCSEPSIQGFSMIPENCSGAADGQIAIATAGLSTLEYILFPTGGEDSISSTDSIFSSLNAGEYTIFVRNVGMPDCRTEDQTVILDTTSPTITEVIITAESCTNAGDASIQLMTDFNGAVEYILTDTAGKDTINTIGLFGDLTSNNYRVAVRGLGDNTCSSPDSILTITADSTPPPVNSATEINLSDIPADEGIAATCGEEICNRMIVQPNAPLDKDHSSYCETFQVAVEQIDTVAEIYLKIKLLHTWTGDLSATLASPDGTVISIFNRPGIDNSSFGCSQNNLDLVFADTAALTATDFANTCNASTGATGYAIKGAFQSIDLFATLHGETASGNWTLCINDAYAALDNGIIEEIQLIVNPARATPIWWDAEEDGNTVFRGDSFNPLAEGLISRDTAASYTYWSSCVCAGCPSERVPVTFITCAEFYEDADGDGYGMATGVKQLVCGTEERPAGYVSNFIDCDDANEETRLAITGELSSGLHQATAQITSDATIPPNEEQVIFQAAESIQLLPGFTVENGGQFLARIDSCGQVISTFTEKEEIARIQLLKDKPQLTLTPTNLSLKVAPNPFTQLTQLTFGLTNSSKVQLTVYDSYGRLVKTFFDGTILAAGKHSVIFEGATNANGLYMVVLKTKDRVVTERVVLQR